LYKYYVSGHYPSSGILETGFFLRLQIKPTEDGVLDKNRAMVNIQRHNICVFE
jgi:hypothetical protein